MIMAALCHPRPSASRRQGPGTLLRGTFKIRRPGDAAHGSGLAAILVPMQLIVGHLVGDYVHDKQPTKFAAIEARWHSEQPASEVLIAWPDPEHERQPLRHQHPVSGQASSAR